jgi:hypothetical protein
MKNLLELITNNLPTRGELIQATAASFFLLVALVLIFATDESWRLN